MGEGTDAAAAARDYRLRFRCSGVVLRPAGNRRADQQRDPELNPAAKVIGTSDCFADKFESEVWYKTMEPRSPVSCHA